MALLLSLLCFFACCYLLIDYFFLGGTFFLLLPQFTCTLLALAGIFIAGMEYRARKPKKKRRTPRALLIANAISGSIAACLWAVLLLMEHT